MASVLLALALLSALALLASLTARTQAVSAGVGIGLLGAETAADGAIEVQIDRTVGLPRGAPRTFFPEVGEGELEGRAWSVSDYRIDDEFHVLIGSAPIEATGTFVRTARLVWWMDPVRRVIGHRAAIESPHLIQEPAAVVSGAAPLAEHEGHPSCHDRPRLTTAFPGSIVDHGSLPHAPEWGGGRYPDLFGRVRLGWYGARALTDLAQISIGGPVELDECPTCWLGVVVATSPTLVSGTGGGVLIALDQLTFEAGTRWSGLVLAAGEVMLNEGASVTGLVRAGGPVTLSDSASVTASVCAAYRSLSAAHTLLRPVRLPGPTRLGPIPSGFD